MSKTMDQRRARWAWALTPPNPSKDYTSLADGTPATIMMDGLGQTVAFYLAKKGDHHKDVLKALASWLLVGFENPEADPAQQQNRKNGEALLDEIMGEDRDRYHQLTDEALTFLVWLKRLGKARQQEQPPPQTAPAHA